MLDVYEYFNSINTPHKQWKSEQKNLLGGVSLTVNDRYSPVDIRQYLKPENAEEQPYSTEKGVQLTREQTNKVLDNMKFIRVIIPELNQIFPYYMNEDHQTKWEWCCVANVIHLTNIKCTKKKVIYVLIKCYPLFVLFINNKWIYVTYSISNLSSHHE